MIKFSDKQLKIPKLMRPVYLVTAGQSKFDRAFPINGQKNSVWTLLSRRQNS